MSLSRFNPLLLILLATAFSGPQPVLAQTATGNGSWTSSSEQGSADGSINPTRTTVSHAGSADRDTDRTSVERLGPDGRYIPYSDTEKESLRINDTTVRTIEKTFGRDADGRRTLIQERQEETRTVAGGARQVTRTLSNPDGDGKLQVVQREVEDSKPVSPGVVVTNTTLMMPDVNGGFSAAVRTEGREIRSNDGTIESKKTTLITDGTGGWKLSEVRETSSKPGDGNVRTKEERVSRPDADGKLAEVERTVTKQSQESSGEKHATVETYSTNVPGVAGDNGLQLVQRETTVQRSSATSKSTVRRVEQARPGAVGEGLQLTQEAIDIVRPNASGTAEQTRTILTTDSNGRMGQVWVDTGRTSDPAAVTVDTKAPVKPASNAK